MSISVIKVSTTTLSRCSISVSLKPPSERTELEVPGQLAALIHACLAKDPAARPQSASELAERLSTIPLSEPWTHERAENWWSMHLPESVSMESCARLGNS